MGGMKVSDLDFLRLLPAFMRDDEAAIALSTVRNFTDYTVEAEITDHEGNVGEVRIFDRMLNGFKIAYDGSAKSATIKLRIKGGM